MHTKHITNNIAQNLFIIRRQIPSHPARDIKIVIEGTEVLDKFSSVPTPFGTLFVRTYYLTLKQPKKVQCTFGFVQKVLTEPDRIKMIPKIILLSPWLHTLEQAYLFFCPYSALTINTLGFYLSCVWRLLLHTNIFKYWYVRAKLTNIFSNICKFCQIQCIQYAQAMVVFRICTSMVAYSWQYICKQCLSSRTNII